MKKVVIIQRTLVHYRKEFFNGLKTALDKEGVELTLIYGKQTREEGLKKDEIDLEWSKCIPNVAIGIGNKTLTWQPCLKELRDKDLVIVESANKLILNYILMIVRKYSKIKLGFWGHGRNMQDAPDSLGNRFKYLFIKQCDWWFAYTQGVKNFLIEKGYPEGQITAVQNAIDTQSLQDFYARVTDAEIEAIREELELQGNHIGIFCGGIYPEKRIDFLLECCIKIKEKIPTFEMLFIGAGMDSPKVIKAAIQYPWIHYLGTKLGEHRVKYFKISSLFLMPGLVGLGILDSFAFETPIVTTNYEFHSPEIEYLEHGYNGIVTENTVEAYSNTVAKILLEGGDQPMRENCRLSARKYTIEQMVDNFKSGILKALN